MKSALNLRGGFDDHRVRHSGAATAAWLRAVAGACVLVLAGCGGGGGDTPPSEAGPTVVGTAGGTVAAVDGVAVLVPAAAASADLSIGVAKDAAGAPAWASSVPAGDIYAITPHGARFDAPVEVRLPIPPGMISTDAELTIAKSEAGSDTWTILSGVTRSGNMLSVSVDSFSYFRVVALQRQPLNRPLNVQAQVTSCTPGTVASGVACTAPFQTLLSLRVQASGDTSPTCDLRAPVFLSVVAWPTLRGNAGAPVPERRDPIYVSNRLEITGSAAVGQPRPLLNQTFDFGVSLAPLVGYRGVWVEVLTECASIAANTGPGATGQTLRQIWSNAVVGFTDLPARTFFGSDGNPYMDLNWVRAPELVDSVAGQALTLTGVLNGGASLGLGDVGGATRINVAPRPATAQNSASVDWERSDDDGLSWRNVARSWEYEANPDLFASGRPWRYWSVGTGLGTLSSADHGALIRGRACYQFPGLPEATCVWSASKRLVVLQQGALPVFTASPTAVLVRAGQSASLNTAAAGAPAPTLQWQTRPANSNGAWVNVSSGSGATSGSYRTPPLSVADNGVQFRAVASNAAGAVEGAPVTVSVSDVDIAPTVTSQPASLSVATGSDAAFAVSARGTEALSYQWRLNGTSIAGATAPLLRLPAVDGSKAGSYTVTVSNMAGSVTSNAATLTVTPGAAAAVAPSIVNQPVSVLVNAGNTATFAVGAAGTGSLRYQWLRNFQPIPGATAAFYSLASAAVGDAGTYSVTVSNDAGQASSFNVTLTVNASAPPTAVSFGTQPAAQVQPAGGSALFAVAANGSGPLSYQWRKDGQPIAGQTGPVLSIAALNGSDAGVYSVTVANALGSVTSNDATLTVLGTPTITTQPQTQTQVAGGSATFSVAATGQSLRYLWVRNGIPVAGATTAQLTKPALTLADNGAVYSVIVFNSAGVAVSNLAVLTVTSNDVAASITQQPTAQSGVVGGSATFTIGTAGTPAPDVVWQTLDANNNWVGIGVTGNSLTLSSLTLMQDGLQVRAIVSNAIAVPNGSQGFTLASNPATLSVVPVLPANALTATQVVAHADRSLVLRPDGSVWAFGKYTDPVTGGFPNSNVPVRPVRVAGLPLAKQVAIGGYSNSWALGRDGTVWGWGFINDVKGFGQGPSNSAVTFASPVQVLMAAGTPIDRVCHVSATTNGAFMVRSDTPGGTCAANEPRSVWFTGESTAAVNGQSGGSYATPLVSLAGNGAGLPTGRWIVEVVTSRDFYSLDSVIFARANDGTVYAWGGNFNGQLGTGDIARRTVPTVVAGWQGATRIAVGGSVTLAVMADGSIKGAGNNNGGNLGIGTTSADVLTPTLLAAPTGASDVSTSYNYPNTMALVDGRLFYWGSGGRFSNSVQFTPIPINAPATPLTGVSVASYHALAIGPGGAVYAWGDFSALGCGDYLANVCDNTQVPKLVTVP